MFILTSNLCYVLGTVTINIFNTYHFDCAQLLCSRDPLLWYRINKKEPKLGQISCFALQVSYVGSVGDKHNNKGTKTFYAYTRKMYTNQTLTLHGVETYPEPNNGVNNISRCYPAFTDTSVAFALVPFICLIGVELRAFTHTTYLYNVIYFYIGGEGRFPTKRMFVK